MVNINQEITKYYEDLNKFALKLTKDEDSALDLLHDTVVRALENKDLYDPSKDAKHWFFAIMENVWINKQIKDSRETFIDDIGYEPSYTMDGGDKQEKRELVIKMIDTLPFTMQEVARLVYIEGMTYKEAAKQLGVVPDTVHQKLKRIVKRLKKTHGQGQEESQPAQEEPASQANEGDQNLPREGDTPKAEAH